jgi:hypothetical protein
MTSYGPPSGPSDSSASPPGGAGAQPGYGASGQRRFNARTANPLDWAILGAALLALLFSFFSFYTYDPTDIAASQCTIGADGGFLFDIGFCHYDGNSGDRISAWHGFFGWSGVLLLIIAAAVVAAAIFAPHLSHPVPVRLAGACAAVLGVVFVFLAALAIPDWPNWPKEVNLSPPQVLDKSVYSTFIANGVGYGWYVVLVLGLIVALLSWLRIQQTSGPPPE